MHIIPLLPPPPSLFSISHTSIHTQTRSVYLVSVYLHHSRIRREGAEGPCGSQRVVSQVVHGRPRFISSSSSYFLFFLWGRCTTNVYVYTVHDPVPRQPLFDRIRLRSLSKSARDGESCLAPRNNKAFVIPIPVYQPVRIVQSCSRLALTIKIFARFSTVLIRLNGAPGTDWTPVATTGWQSSNTADVIFRPPWVNVEILLI